MKNVFVVCILFCSCLIIPAVYAEEAFDSRGPAADQSKASSNGLKLQTALMCEDVQDHNPVNPAVVFSVAAGKVFCFTVFKSVQEKTHIYHAWYHQDKLITKKKLSLEQPQWKTYSSVQLREDDRGPWRVEILDRSDKALETLRFSITD